MKKLKLFVWGLAFTAVSSAAANASTVLFIADRDGTGDGGNAIFKAADDAMIAHLESLGKTVRVRDDAAASAADLLASNIVVISSTVGSSTVNNNANGANTAQILAAGRAVLLMETGLSEEMKLNKGSSTGGAAVLSSVTLVALESPYTDGLALGSVQITNGVQQVGAFSNPNAGSVGFGAFEPHASATVLTNDAISNWGFAFPGVGASSYTHNDAAGTLVIGLPFNNGAFSDRTAAGEQLFNNAVMAAMNFPEPSSVAMAALGLLGALLSGRRR